MHPTSSSRLSRRGFLALTGGASAAATAAMYGFSSAPAWAAPRFPDDPFTLGVASGDPTPDGVVLCNGRGIHDTSAAELAVTLILSSLRGIPDFVRRQDQRRWHYEWRPALADKRVVIVGYGAIGEAIERRLIPFETEVVRVARTARPGVHAISELPDLLPDADVGKLARELGHRLAAALEQLDRLAAELQWIRRRHVTDPSRRTRRPSDQVSTKAGELQKAHLSGPFVSIGEKGYAWL